MLALPENTLRYVMEALGNSSARDISFVLFVLNTLQQIFILVWHYEGQVAVSLYSLSELDATDRLGGTKSYTNLR